MRDCDVIFLSGPEDGGRGLSPRLALQSAIRSDRGQPCYSQWVTEKEF